MKSLLEKKKTGTGLSKSRIKEEFDSFIITQDHPCLMAQTVFRMNKVDLHIYTSMDSRDSAKTLLKDLKNYIQNYDFESKDFLTFLAVYPNEKAFTEEDFETTLWQHLQHLHELDDQEWDPAVSQHPNSPEFSFSLGGKAFYIVGLHPNSSRLARQSPYPAIAFNLHWQFEKLREMDTYHAVRDKIRERDKALQGTINPMLRDFGTSSEAKQYSGRAVEKEWQCPFHKKD